MAPPSDTETNLSLSNDIRIVSEFKHLNAEVAFTKAAVQKHGGM